jgi:hypothetical protein
MRKARRRDYHHPVPKINDSEQVPDQREELCGRVLLPVCRQHAKSSGQECPLHTKPPQDRDFGRECVALFPKTAPPSIG